MSDETPARQEFTFSLVTEELGKRNFTFYDAVVVDDIFVHLAKREFYRLLTGIDSGVDVSRAIKDPLILDDYQVK